MVVLTEVGAEDMSDTQGLYPLDQTAPVWSDVVPVPQDDGPDPLCPILYDPAMNGDSAEPSERALVLTEFLVHANPANYSVWQYRARVLIEMAARAGGDGRLREELGFLDAFAVDNMKNYQIWQHRRVIVSLLGDPTREMAFIASVLDVDAKNYHTWTYRQWVLAYFAGLGPVDGQLTSPGAGQFPAMWDAEPVYVDELLARDVRNNSAYNHRWFVMFARRAGNGAPPPADDVLRDSEVRYALGKLALAPNNASAWNYLRGLHEALEPPRELASISDDVLAFVAEKDHAYAAQHREVDEDGRTPPGALEWLFDSVLERKRDDHGGAADRKLAELHFHHHAGLWEYVRKKRTGSQLVGRYRPWDVDPSKVSFNEQTGKHPLGKRGRKTDEGLLTVSGSCDNHIGQGVRYNAEKKQIGSYFTTPVWSFRCKCHLCQHWFEIRTDPKNTRYVVESGARKQAQAGDEDEDAAPELSNSDPFAQLEEHKARREEGSIRQARVHELESLADVHWKDPYARNAHLRSAFRRDKRARIERELRDAALRERIGWSSDKALVGESFDDTGLRTPDIQQQWADERLALDRERMGRPRLRDAAPLRMHAHAERRASPARAVARTGSATAGRRESSAPMSAAAQRLAGRVLSSGRQQRDPFLRKGGV
ncbi:galactose-6-sulfurylase [Malassezia sp. CBS 17886]|nr:galactose-6-sulfurylase [Malassezia sp. CBS 17886]